MPRIAAIDAGSNALRMMIGDVDLGGHIAPIQSLRLPVRLGEDVFRMGALQEATIRQAVEAFRQFKRSAEESGVEQLRAIATSALREAANRDILLGRISADSGIDVEVISATEEARLIHLAVASVIDLKGRRALLVDIGGGSVEVTLSERGHILSAHSYQLGAVRLLQELEGIHDLVAGKSIRPFVQKYAESARLRIRRQIAGRRISLCVVTGGTAEDLGRLSQKIFKKPDERSVTLGELQDLIERIERMDVKQRMRKLDLRADRADVILPAAIILQIIAREAHVRRVFVPHVGVKDGLMIEMTMHLRPGRQSLSRAQVLASVKQLGHKYDSDPRHAALTARLALQLFDQSRALHSLGADERLLLEAAAWLHDIGHFIRPEAHERHGYYILRSTPLVGLTDEQQQVVAHLVRYHRDAGFPPDGADFTQLTRRLRVLITQLTALLRLADALDSGHSGDVRSVELSEKKKRWQLTVRGRGDLSLERREAERRSALFERVFGVELEVKARD